MTTKTKHSGACLCGGVRVTVTSPEPTVSVCHCHMCRRWGGGPLLCVHSDNGASFEGGDAIGIFPSSDWAERGFCTRCGTHLFYRLKGTEQYGIPVGLLDDGAWRVTDDIFVDEKPAYYELADDTRKLTGAEVFALYAPSDTSA
jgi:hypothetical protein